MAWRWRIVLAVAVWAGSAMSAYAQKNFGFDNRKPSGQPYLTPQETVKRFQMAPGWEAQLVAGEPDLANPIAFTIDEKGRIWVVECFEYPKRTPKGQKPRDRIKIIEETPQGPKVTIWAEGKDLPIGWDLASGIEVGHGGVFLGAPPYLFFLSDPGNTGKCTKQEILLKGFGSQDTHETLNTFQWGPDSKLYGLHGVFTQSEVKPGEKDEAGVKMNAAVWRYDVRAKKFDIFAEGTSNPWGMDFDARGNCFVACCVIPHLFHIVPGGIYRRQAGVSLHPYAYGQLNEICDHQHHKESGWAHAGCLVLDGSHVPEAYRGSVLMGSIHGCSIKRDVLRPNGSSFIASCEKDFLVSGDKNFRPINLRWGPDGSIYCIDWHDQNPCHQAAAESWDYQRGRIYKFRPKQSAKGEAQAADLSKKASKDLVAYLQNDNPYYYRTALRILSERRSGELRTAAEELLLDEKKSDLVRLRALWAYYATGAQELPPTTLKSPDRATVFLRDASPDLRSWIIRLAGETQPTFLAPLLNTLAEIPEKAPQVRLQIASFAQRPTFRPPTNLESLHALMRHKEDVNDPCLPLMIWLAYEPYVPEHPKQILGFLNKNSSGNALITNEILPRTMRRLAATGKAEDLNACIAFLGDVKDSTVRRQALEGLTLAFKNRQADAPPAWKNVFPELAKDSDKQVQGMARKLAVNFQDAQAIARVIKVVADQSKAVTERLDGLRDLALAHPPQALPVLQEILAKDKSTELRAETLRTLSAYDNAELAGVVLKGWASYPPLVRGEAVNLLSGRKNWAKELLAAVGTKTVGRTDLTDNTILKIRAFKDQGLNDLIEKNWGRFRDTPKELGGLMDKMRDQLFEGKGSFARGRVVFENQCAKCHKFDGKGYDVGPNLDGAARDIEYLLINVIDPNRVVGQPYYVRSVELKSGRIETGLLHAEDAESVTLKVENNILKVIQKKDIEGKVLVHEKSVMPEGLANNMTVQDFRDLVRYAMAHPFLTEISIAGPVAKSVEPKSVTWTRVAVGVPGRIVLPAGKKGENSISLVSADVTAPEAMRTRLLVGAAHAVKISINDTVVYQGQPGATPVVPDQASVEVELRAGVNRLVVQNAHEGDRDVLFVRLHDPDRKLRQDDAK